jgi:hypothetical protein
MLGYLEGRNNSCTVVCGGSVGYIRRYRRSGTLGKADLTSTAAAGAGGVGG